MSSSKFGSFDRLDERQPLGRGVDDVGFLTSKRLDDDRDALRPCFRRDAFPEVHELLERFFLRESFGDSPRAAAAEAEDLHAEPVEAREGLLDVGHLLLDIRGLGPGQPDGAREEQVGVGRRDAGLLHPLERCLEFGVRQRRDLRRAELDVVEPCRLGGLEPLQPHAVPDEHFTGLLCGRDRGKERDQAGGNDEGAVSHAGNVTPAAHAAG